MEIILPHSANNHNCNETSVSMRTDGSVNNITMYVDRKHKVIDINYNRGVFNSKSSDSFTRRATFAIEISVTIKISVSLCEN